MAANDESLVLCNGLLICTLVKTVSDMWPLSVVTEREFFKYLIDNVSYF